MAYGHFWSENFKFDPCGCIQNGGNNSFGPMPDAASYLLVQVIQQFFRKLYIFLPVQVITQKIR